MRSSPPAIEAADATLDAPGGLGLIARYGGRHGRRVAMGVAVWQTAKPLYKKIKGIYDLRTTFTITVEGTDEIFGDLHEWMLSLLDTGEQRALIASTGEGGGGWVTGIALTTVSPEPDGSYPGEEDARTAPRVRLRYDGGREHTVTMGGHKIKVMVARDEVKNWDKIPDNWQAYSQRMVFVADSAAGRDAVLSHLERMLDARQKKPGPPPLMMPPRWGGHWIRRNDLPPRTLDSIILKDGQLDRLIEDLAEFLGSEDDYVRTCQPWHRGYLLHGSPGTGKTSVVKALAHHFRIPVYYLPLGDLEADADLTGLVSQVKPRSLLLLEDVDVYRAMRERNDDAKGLTLSAMLNALDGIWTPHGLITVMTTNDRSALDPALIRAGRIDYEEEFTDLNHHQALRLMRWFYDNELAVDDVDDGYQGRSPAELIGAMSKNKKDPYAAWDEFRGLVAATPR